MSIRVMRRDLVTSEVTVHAGYGDITLSTAVHFLEHAASEEVKANTQKLSFRSKDEQVGDKIRYERVVSDGQRDVVSFYLSFETDKETALQNLQQALSDATETGLLDDLAGDIHPDSINGFCDAVATFDDGESGQDRDSYSDTQDRDSYTYTPDRFGHINYPTIVEWVARDVLSSTEDAEDIEANVDRFMEDMTRSVQEKAEEIGVDDD